MWGNGRGSSEGMGCVDRALVSGDGIKGGAGEGLGFFLEGKEQAGCDDFFWCAIEKDDLISRVEMR